MIRLFRDIVIGESGGEPDDKKLFEKYVYWTKEEVGCYNKALDDALEIVRKRWGSSLIIEDIQALKKKP